MQLSGNEVSRLVDHARRDIGPGEVLGPVGLPGVGVGRVADGVVAVTQLDGPIVVGGAEVGDGADPLTAIAEQRDRGDVLITAGRQGDW